MLLRSVFIFSAFCFCSLNSQKIDSCDGLSKDNEFRNPEKYDGPLSVVTTIKKDGTTIKTEETLVASKDPKLRRGTVKSTKDNSEVIYSYFYDTNEYFRAKGHTCESRDLLTNVIRDDASHFVPKSVVDINPGIFEQHLGPFSLLRLAFASKDNLYGFTKTARKWRQCINDKLSIEYTLDNGDEPTNVVIKVTTDNGVEVWTYEFEEIETVGDDADHAPIGSGCERRNPRRPEIYAPLSFETEINLQDNRVASDGSIDTIDSETITLTVYDNLLSIIAKAKDGQRQVRNVVDNSASFVYANADDDTCKIESLLEDIEKELKIPYTTKEKANLLSPTITNVDEQDDQNQYSFQFLGTSDESEFLVYERVIADFYNDGSNMPSIVTHYAENKDRKPRGTKQQRGPTKKIQIKVFENEKKEKVSKNILLDYQSFKENFTDAVNKFNVRKCFKDSDVTTFQINFKADITKADFVKQKQNIVQSFIDNIKSDVSVVRIPRVDLERRVDSKAKVTFVLEGDLLERPDPLLFFTKYENQDISGGDVDKTAITESDCVTSCLDKNNCKGMSFCSNNRCLISKITSLNPSETCNTFLKQGSYKTRSDLIDSLQSSVDAGKLKISLPGSNDFVADKFSRDTSVDPNKQKFPDVEQMLPGQNAFSAHIEKVDLEKKTTTFYYETRDIAQRRGEVRRVVEDFTPDSKYDQRLIFFYDTNEFFTVTNTTCEMKKIEDIAKLLEPQDILPSVVLEALNASGFQVIGPSVLLDYGKDVAAGRKRFSFEKTTYNGISNAQKWSLKNTQSGFTLDYYFYEADFGLSPIAVEVIIGGKKIIYNFADFTPEVNVHRFKSLPDGMGCKRLNPENLPPPSFVHEYKETLELVTYKFGDKRISKMQTLSVAVSTNFKLAVFVPRNYTPFPHPMRKVVDDNANVVYTTDLFKGTCEIKRKPEMDIKQWPDLDLSIDYNVLDPRIFMLTDFFQFLGTTEQRGVSVNIYETIISDFLPSDLGQFLPAVITHFTPDTNTSIPMRVIVRVFNSDDRKTMRDYFEVNIHNYQELTQNDQKQTLFDISNCFLSPDQQTWFQIDFVDDLETDRLVLMSKKKAIEMAFRDAMEKDFGIPPSRLPTVIVDESDQGVFVTAKLLERPPFFYSFDKTEKKQMDQTFGREILIASEDKCGQKCYEDDSCIGLSYCTNFECAPLYKEYNLSVASNLKDNEFCNVYTKLDTTSTVGAGDSMIESILFMLQEMTLNRGLSIKITDSTGTSEKAIDISLVATELKQNVEPGFSREYEERIHLPFVSKPTAFDISKELQKSYYVNKRNRRLDYSKVSIDSRKAVKIDIGACKQLCDDDPLCKSFSYCTANDQECIVSTIDGDAVVNSITTTSQSCSILSKYYSAQYEKRSGYEVKVAKTYIQVPNSEQCAKSCSTETKFKCLSFDVCSDGKENSCYLHTYHLFVNNAEAEIAAKSDCDHYSKKFTFDFNAVFNQKLKDVNVIDTIKSLSVEQCAHSCINDDNCKSFEFCENVENAQISNQCRTTSSDATNSALVLQRNCTVYTKSATGTQQQANNETKGYSKGLAAFLAILLFIVGTAIGVVAIWLIYTKFTVRS